MFGDNFIFNFLGTDLFPEIDINNNSFYYDSIDLNESNPNNSFTIIYDEDKNQINNNEIYSHNNDEIKENKEENNSIIVNKNDKLTKTLNYKSTKDNSLDNNLIEKENKKKLGRKRKKDKYDAKESDDNTIVHTKESDDNIRVKFKRLFSNNLILFFNLLLECSSNKILSKLNLKKINTPFICNIKKEHNIEMLNMTVGEFLSQDICKKCKNYPWDHNAKIIRLIYEEKDEKLVKVLNKRVGDMMKIFCNENIGGKIFKKFKRLNYYIDKMKEEKKENDNYINMFLFQAENFETLYQKIDGRKEKK